MRPGRLLLCLLLVAGGLAVAAVRLPRALRAVHPSAAAPLAPDDVSPAAGSASRNAVVAAARLTARAPIRRTPPVGSGGSVVVLERVGIECAGGVLLIGGLAMGLVARRALRRGRRAYALYELHLSTHDQAKGQDLEDMVESIANIVRAWPADRIRHGQPYLALELICGVAPADGGRLEMEWSINVRCEPRSVSALDGAISAAYPDVRLGRDARRAATTAPGGAARARVSHAVSQGAQLRLLAHRRRGGAGVRAT